MEIDKTQIAGIVTLLILLSSGTTYFIQDSGTKTGCRAGWELVSQGEYEGYYKCTTLSGDRFEMCFEVYNSANTENYWCKKGIIIKETYENKNYENKNYGDRIYCTREECA